MIGHNVGLGAADNRADTDSWAAQERMFKPFKIFGVISLESLDYSGHRHDGIAAQLRRRAVGGFAPRFQFQPHAAFVGGYYLEPCWFAYDGQIRCQTAP